MRLEMGTGFAVIARPSFAVGVSDGARLGSGDAGGLVMMVMQSTHSPKAMATAPRPSATKGWRIAS